MKLETITMTELLDDVYEARLPIIKNLLYPGAYIFAGPPKVGKSFMVAQIGYHVSKGMPLWDMEVSKGTVLYLALEDVNERLQQRLAKMFPSLEDNDNLYFATKSEVLNKGLMEQLNGFVEAHKNTKMIIIDTLQKIKDNVRDSSNYANDYDIIAKLKNFADKYNICLLIVHHTRKQESNDSFDMISGTQGLLGAADGALVITREQRTSNKAVIETSGREQQAIKLNIEMDMETCRWKLNKIENELWKEPEDRTLSILRDFIEEENGLWCGRACDLLNAISIRLQDIGEEYKPNSIVRKLNVSVGKLRENYGIIYHNKRTNQGSKITLRKEEN